MREKSSRTELNDAMITFLHETKEGKYVSVPVDMVEMPRNPISRDEYFYEEDIPMFYSISN